MGRKKSVPLIKICPICQKPFEVKPYQNRRKYCSYACVDEMKRQQYKGRHYHFHKLDDEKEREICELYKDKEMPANTIAPIFNVSIATIIRVIRKHKIERTVKEAAALRIKQNPDLAKLAAQKKIGRFLGEKSPLYKNGCGRWTRNVMERDNYTCQDCGLHDPEIVEAHHIKPRKEFPELAYDIDNGVTVCPNCHKRRHLHLCKDGKYRPRMGG